MTPERKEYMREWREDNKDRVVAIKKLWYAANREHVNTRNKKWALSNKGKISLKSKRWYEKNVYRKKMSNHLLHKGYKERVVNAYGGACTCCGESEIRFLTLEHIKHNGKQHRNSVVGSVYLDVIRRGFPRDEFTILCMNCNWGTRFGHKCPHQITILELVA